MLAPSLVARRKGLTHYPQGSLRELWHISFPLVISLMSISSMLFLDRLFLAHYSLDTLNASAHAGAISQFLQFWVIATASIAEIFVGRNNGAARYDRLGSPVWQMLWLCVFSAFLYVPVGLFLSPYLFSHETYRLLEIQYFTILTCFIPFAAASAALAAFYIGRGKVKFVTIVILLSNAINVLLDTVLIFGYKDWISPWGIEGAAASTVIAQVFQTVVLFTAFIGPKNRLQFGTGKWKFKKRLFKSCLGIGLPGAVAHSFEIFMWVVLFDMMSRLGSDYLTVITISQSVLFLFTFLTEGLSKGATAIASNLIGSEKHALVWKLLASGVKLYAIIFTLLGIILVWHPHVLIQWFLPNFVTISESTHKIIHAACFWVWIYFLFDGVMWLLIGLLTAAADTRFIMKIGAIAPIVIVLIPSYLFIYEGDSSPHFIWALIALYACICSAIYYCRFKSEKWQSITLEPLKSTA